MAFLARNDDKIGFQQRWIDLIMKCISSVNYRIKVNGEYTQTIIPQHGLRQGDPLSPYLFLLCAEGFSAMLQKAEQDQKIVGIRVCQQAPSVNHLFFLQMTHWC